MIEKVANFGDDRQNGFGVHCGGPPETKDHAPPKVFLDMPYPHHRPTLPRCLKCNNGFTADEEYLACFVECVVCGTTDPEKLTREKVQKSLRRNTGLRERIERSKRDGLNGRGERLPVWTPEEDRVREVVVKLARCHAAYELNEPQLDEPDHVGFWPWHRCLMNSGRTSRLLQKNWRVGPRSAAGRLNAFPWRTACCLSVVGYLFRMADIGSWPSEAAQSSFVAS